MTKQVNPLVDVNVFASTLCLMLKVYLLKNDPTTKFGKTSLNEQTFNIDFLAPNLEISSKNFKTIEKTLIKLALNLGDYAVFNLDEKTALSKLAYDEFSCELIKQAKLKTYTFIKFEKLDFWIWHEFPILAKISSLQFIHLLATSGVYWQNDEKNLQLVRVSGCAFDSIAKLNSYLTEYEENKQRDHRRLGKSLELFTFNQLAGQGMPIWLPNGTILKNLIGNYVHECQMKYGFSFVSTPILGSLELYKISGHYDHYHEDMFPAINLENETMILRPMTCPHHCLVYLNKPHSYKELPIRLAEDSIMHRYESSGALIGLERVRMMTLLDNHIFCRPDQIENEIINAYNIINEVLTTFHLKIDHIDLALHDPSNKVKFIDNQNMWQLSESQLEQALKKLNVSFTKQIGDAAFYGPKIDFQCKTALNKIITCSTIQLDFSLPNKFATTYVDANNKETNCVIIHLGIIGTYERFIATLLEQTKGILPLWLAPVQVQVIPVNNAIHLKSCQTLALKLLKNQIRCQVDCREERLGKKIYQAQTQKIPLQIVIGDQEANDLTTINYRKYGSEQIVSIGFNDFVKMIQAMNVNHE